MEEHYCCSFQMYCCSLPARCELQCHIFILEPLYSLKIFRYGLCDSFVTADGSHLAWEKEMKKHGPDWLGSFRTVVDRGQIRILYIKGHLVMKTVSPCFHPCPPQSLIPILGNETICLQSVIQFKMRSCKLDVLTEAYHVIWHFSVLSSSYFFKLYLFVAILLPHYQW